MSTITRGDYNYFITFTNDFSRSKSDYNYLMKHNTESFETFKEFPKEVENELCKTIKALRVVVNI